MADPLRGLMDSRPVPSTWNTPLGPLESIFQQWAQNNKVPLTKDYDMRGFFLGMLNKDPAAVNAVDPNDNRLHFPDKWKTPLHRTFSNESIYAGPNAPSWNNKDQLVDKQGNILFDDRKLR